MAKKKVTEVVFDTVIDKQESKRELTDLEKEFRQDVIDASNMMKPSFDALMDAIKEVKQEKK